MKLLHTSANMLSTKEFNDVTAVIADEIYDVEPEIHNYYDIHIDIINDEWHVEFVPKFAKIPVLKVDAYTAFDSDNHEVLHIVPNEIIKFPDSLNVDDYESALTSITPYNVISDFILKLFDFEYYI